MPSILCAWRLAGLLFEIYFVPPIRPCFSGNRHHSESLSVLTAGILYWLENWVRAALMASREFQGLKRVVLLSIANRDLLDRRFKLPEHVIGRGIVETLPQFGQQFLRVRSNLADCAGSVRAIVNVRRVEQLAQLRQKDFSVR